MHDNESELRNSGGEVHALTHRDCEAADISYPIELHDVTQVILSAATDSFGGH